MRKLSMLETAGFEAKKREFGTWMDWGTAQTYFGQRLALHKEQLRPFMDELEKKSANYDAVGFLDRDARLFWHASDNSPTLAQKPRYLLGVSGNVIPIIMKAAVLAKSTNSKTYEEFLQRTRTVFEQEQKGGMPGERKKTEDVYEYLKDTGMLNHKRILLVDSAYSGTNMVFLKHLIESRHPDKQVDVYLHTTVENSVVPAFQKKGGETKELMLENAPHTKIVGAVTHFERKEGKMVPVYGPPLGTNLPMRQMEYWIDKEAIKEAMQ